MAGFFGFFDYTKPGPGVPKDAPPKPRIVVFFEIFTRKFWNLVKLNLLFTIFNLPAILAVVFIVLTYELALQGHIGIEVIFKLVLGAIAVCIPLVTVGPAQAGFTYVLRNYAREEHAFIWWDFKEHALKNFKEGIVISTVDFLVTLVIIVDLHFYFNVFKGNFLMAIASMLLIVSLIIYLIMHMYIYPMLVTFKLTVRQIYKNALIFAIIKFFPNLGVLLICALIIAASFLFFPVIGLLMFVFITMSLVGLITNFFVYPCLKKYMIDKIEESNNVENQV